MIEVNGWWKNLKARKIKKIRKKEFKSYKEEAA